MPNYEITHQLTINKVIKHEHIKIQLLYLNKRSVRLRQGYTTYAGVTIVTTGPNEYVIINTHSLLGPFASYLI